MQATKSGRTGAKLWLLAMRTWLLVPLVLVGILAVTQPASARVSSAAPPPSAPGVPVDTTTSTPTTTPTPCAPVWSVVPSPNGGTSHNSLYGVGVVSAND